ncbi:MAG: hypothetical protein JSU87_05725 [Gemmatimonadota bacterium]|nr:MAG: hypothetical protein JSU87_05725 [Gemmatimonadota bacterium]
MERSNLTQPLVRGTCFALFAYDVAPYIDLAVCEERILTAKHRQTVRKRRGLEYFEYRPTPLRVTEQTSTVSVAGHESRGSVDLVFYDFGAVTVSFAIPFRCSFSELIAFGDELYDDENLSAAARQSLERVLGLLDGSGFKVADVVEDYIVFQIEDLEPHLSPAELLTKHGNEIAQLLRAETEPLSEQETADALLGRIAFGSSDLTLIDWNAAVLIGEDIEDILTVIEFANVQLLEMRYLDRQLDEALEESYALVSRVPRNRRSALRFHHHDVERVARLQVDGAILFERVTNALKVFGEEYMGRVYTLTARRLRLSDWDTSAMRKLATLDTIYSKLTDRAATQRLEFLEWIIVFLIALSIVLSFI